MSGKRPIVYWDSCAFLALLKGETHHRDGAFEAISMQADAFDRGEIVLATSAVGVAEVLAASLPDDVRARFEKMMDRSNFQLVNVTGAVARAAAIIRSHCRAAAKSSQGEPYLLSTPDAIHVASAALLEAEVLVTLDEKNKTNTLRERELGMSQVARYYPIPNIRSVRIERPAQGLPGTSLF